MQTKGQTSKEYFKALSIIHAVLLVGQLLFMGALLLSNDNQETENSGNLFLFIAPALALGGVLGGIFLERTRINSIKKKKDLKEKVSSYQTTLIMKFALLEGPSLFALVCYSLTVDYTFLTLSGLLILILLANRPSRDKMIKDLELNREERSLIENPQAIIAEIKVSK
ncbi:hypothetical protein [Owenweeksia hongkongensis]|uniref:hypothetical protein n=1 Tax=Owenweeksia hongkongensis TaxID=253245 RepID=UPI003A935A1A